jgi:hypothetical protein
MQYVMDMNIGARTIGAASVKSSALENASIFNKKIGTQDA